MLFSACLEGDKGRRRTYRRRGHTVGEVVSSLSRGCLRTFENLRERDLLTVAMAQTRVVGVVKFGVQRAFMTRGTE